MSDFERRYNSYESYAIVGTPGVAVIKKGNIAKTTRLIGCFVPVVIYQSEVILGHFGPAQSLKARTLIAPPNSRVTPKDIVLYRSSLADNPWWRERGNLYEAYFQVMTDALADIIGIEKNAIHPRVYPLSSNIVVDWTQESEPNISIVPTTI